MPECPEPTIIRERQYFAIVTQGYSSFSDSEFDLSKWRIALTERWTTTLSALPTEIDPSNTYKREFSGSGSIIYDTSYEAHHKQYTCDGIIGDGYDSFYSGGGTYTINDYGRSRDTDPWVDYTTSSSTWICIDGDLIPGSNPPAYYVGIWRQNYTYTDHRNSSNNTSWSSIESYSSAAAPKTGFSSNSVKSYEDETGWTSWLAQAFALTDPDDCWIPAETWEEAEANVSPPTSYGDMGSLNRRKIRLRFRIPPTHKGSHFKLSWDEYFFPTDYDSENSNSPQPVAINIDKTAVWEGPGDPEDDESWLTDWELIESPDEAGEVRVVNLRYTCYSGSVYGAKPQTLGEAYEPTP